MKNRPSYYNNNAFLTTFAALFYIFLKYAQTDLRFMNIAIIGGGAAGFFAAIATKENYPNANVTILEKSKKTLAKVKISGGGRCNVTNGCMSIKELVKAYPRGDKALKKAFRIFNTKHTMEWFEERGVPLIIQEDNCVFPVSQDSQSIIDCFLREVRRLGIRIEVGIGVKQLQKVDNGITITLAKEGIIRTYDKVIVATGGCPKLQGLNWLKDLGHKIAPPVPSLFTFNMPQENITELMGIVVKKTRTSIQGTKLKSDGPLLITHWGMSGPSILKLSAFGARILSDCNYNFNVQVNWVNELNNALVTNQLQTIIKEHPNKLLTNYRPYLLPERLWHYLLVKSQLPATKKWSELGKKGLNKLVALLTNDVYAVQGKTTFKEEFVTCGGVHLDSINTNTMESKGLSQSIFCW